MDEVKSVEWLRWIVALPLLGAAVNAFVGRRLGERAVALVACVPVALAFLLSVRVALALVALPPEQRVLVDNLWSWIDTGSLSVDVAFLADPLSSAMLLVITGVGGLIHLYSVGYMHGDQGIGRYFALLNLFTAMMSILVLGDNLLLLFVGWEGVGLCSFALIGFWYADARNAAAGTKAFLVNRVGDFAFALGVFLLFWSSDALGAPTLRFRELIALMPRLAELQWWGWAVPGVAAALLFAGATGKSAQIPLFVWLPDAMAGPTPVSALIHAATMVTAGVYLVARLSFLYEAAPEVGAVVAWVGAATALLAATMAVVQHDLKKVLAYSTISQLGYMFLALGVGAYAAAVFHLITHAFFKACLFLAAGSVIHAMHHEQDMRRMGGLKDALPRTHATFLVSALALAGVPPLAGFVSKDAILAASFTSERGGVVLWAVALATAALTAFYMTRQVWLIFYGERRFDPAKTVHESPATMVVPLLVLASLAVVGGLLGWPAILGGSHRLETWLAPVVARGPVGHASHLLEFALIAASVAAAVLGGLAGWSVYAQNRPSPQRLAAVGAGMPYHLVSALYYVDEIYDAIFVRGVLRLGTWGAAFDARVLDGILHGLAATTRGLSRLSGWFDQHAVDAVVDGVGSSALGMGSMLRRLQSGRIHTYLYVALAALAAVLLAQSW